MATDPTSGSGSLLINIGQSAAKRMGSRDNIKYYAQELKENTYNLITLHQRKLENLKNIKKSMLDKMFV